MVELCTEIVEARGLDMQGIYRVPGNTGAVNMLQELLNNSDVRPPPPPPPPSRPSWGVPVVFPKARIPAGASSRISATPTSDDMPRCDFRKSPDVLACTCESEPGLMAAKIVQFPDLAVLLLRLFIKKCRKTVVRKC